MVRDKDLHPIHPGEILREELLKTYQISPKELARSIKVEENIVKEIIKEKRNITPEISYRLGLYWGLREDYWLDLQKHYELECWKNREKKEIMIENEVLPYRLIFQANLWRLDYQTFKNLIGSANFCRK